MAEGARLESVCTATYREFESLTHRHIQEKRRLRASFLYLKSIKTKSQIRDSSRKEKVSILEDVDFELELLHCDEVNVATSYSYCVTYMAKRAIQNKNASAK